MRAVEERVRQIPVAYNMVPPTSKEVAVRIRSAKRAAAALVQALHNLQYMLDH